MSDSKLYYTPPSNDEFDEVKRVALALWDEVDSDHDKYGYATEKKNRIKDIENAGDNFMYIVAMFDPMNQRVLASLLSPETRLAVRVRMIDGGNPESTIPF